MDKIKIKNFFGGENDHYLVSLEILEGSLGKAMIILFNDEVQGEIIAFDRVFKSSLVALVHIVKLEDTNSRLSDFKDSVCDVKF